MSSGSDSSDSIEIDLRQPIVAGVLAWLLPGAGHFYQRRFAKGVVFLTCVLTTYFFGLALAEGHVVYHQWKKEERRWQYFCQLGTGLPALPALIQSHCKANGDPPLFNERWPGLMTPPDVKREIDVDELSALHEKYKWRFELGTLYTMIAGLLNILAIYDACCGPVLAVPDDPEKKKSPAG